MQTPGTPGTGISGAQFSLASELHHTRPGPRWQRLHRDSRLQRALEHLYHLGSRPVGEFIVELLDEYGSPASALDRLLDWRTLNSGDVAALRADRFPLHPVGVPRS